MIERLLAGAGAQGRVVLEAWRAQHPEDAFAFVDDNPALHGTSVLGAPVRGELALLAQLAGEAIIAVGCNPVRLALAAAWRGVRWGTVVHPSAVVAFSAAIGAGAVVLAGAIVNPGAQVGAHAIVHTGAIVEHDCVIEEGAAVGPGACMGGRVRIGRGAFLSAGVTVAPRLRIGAGSVVGAGAVVVADLPDGVLAFGVPARVIRAIGPDFDWRTLL